MPGSRAPEEEPEQESDGDNSGGKESSPESEFKIVAYPPSKSGWILYWRQPKWMLRSVQLVGGTLSPLSLVFALTAHIQTTSFALSSEPVLPHRTAPYLRHREKTGRKNFTGRRKHESVESKWNCTRVAHRDAGRLVSILACIFISFVARVLTVSRQPRTMTVNLTTVPRKPRPDLITQASAPLPVPPRVHQTFYRSTPVLSSSSDILVNHLFKVSRFGTLARINPLQTTRPTLLDSQHAHRLSPPHSPSCTKHLTSHQPQSPVAGQSELGHFGRDLRG